MAKQMRALWRNLKTGPKVPDVVYVIVEVSKGTRSKYEMDEKTGALILDRELFTSMVYPGDYGLIPQTFAEDGDPLDALILVSRAHYPGTVIPARPIAILGMEDEKGKDDKILAVPEAKVDPSFKEIKDLKDLSDSLRAEITHFFEHMKELEPGKWVKVEKWQGAKEAKKYILSSVKLYQKKFGS